jgi:hypothetical protein
MANAQQYRMRDQYNPPHLSAQSSERRHQQLV